MKNLDFRIWSKLEKKYLNTEGIGIGKRPINLEFQQYFVLSHSVESMADFPPYGPDNTWKEVANEEEIELELCTGRLDKKQKKIFDGDKVVINDYDPIQQVSETKIGYVVVSLEEGTYVLTSDNERITLYHCLDRDIEIIGNKHD